MNPRLTRSVAQLAMDHISHGEKPLVKHSGAADRSISACLATGVG
jgi:hypothetical protein